MLNIGRKNYEKKCEHPNHDIYKKAISTAAEKLPNCLKISPMSQSPAIASLIGPRAEALVSFLIA